MSYSKLNFHRHPRVAILRLVVGSGRVNEINSFAWSVDGVCTVAGHRDDAGDDDRERVCMWASANKCLGCLKFFVYTWWLQSDAWYLCRGWFRAWQATIHLPFPI